MKYKAYKMSGAGNLFYVIDNRDLSIDDRIKSKLFDFFSSSSFKAEGYIFLKKSENNTFSSEFFNPDGSCGMMCGNGGRAIVRFAENLGLIDDNQNITFDMADKVYSAKIDGDLVSIYFTYPELIDYNMPISVCDKIIRGVYVENGSHHFCVNIANYDDYRDIAVELFPLNEIGKLVRYNEAFLPLGTNFNIYSIDNNIIKLRTYERGVEAETGACGTGAIATAFAAEKFGIEFPMTIIPTSGEKLVIDLNDERKVILTGPAVILGYSEIEV